VKNFKLFTEDLFGFDAIEKRPTPQEEDDDLPIHPFSSEWFLDSLGRKKIGNRVPSQPQIIFGIINWDTTRVRLTPNLNISIERQIEDLLGQKTWICKALFHPDLKKYAGKEDTVAEDVFQEVQKIYFEALDRPTETYNLLLLTQRMASRVQHHLPSLYNYKSTIKKSENYYVISLAITNAGVGKITSMLPHLALSPEATIDVNFNEERGLVHIILTTVGISTKGEPGWELDVPMLDAFFAPSQNKDEIIEPVLTTIRYY